MQKRALGNTGYQVSTVVYGGIVSMNDGQEASDRYVAWAMERGVNYFDVAPTYGDAEEKVRPLADSLPQGCLLGVQNHAAHEKRTPQRS